MTGSDATIGADDDPAGLAARAARLGRRLTPDQLSDMSTALAAVEPVLRGLPTVGLLADGSDPAAGDAWLRPGAGPA